MIAVRILPYVFSAFAFVPLFVWRGLYYQYSTTNGLVIMGLAELVLVLYFWGAIHEPTWRRPLTPLEWVVAGFLLISLVAGFVGVDPLLSFWSSFDRMTGGLLGLHLFAILFVASRVFHTANHWRHFFIFTTAVGLLISSLHLLSFTGVSDSFWVQRDATIGNSTFFSIYLLFQIFISLLLVVTPNRVLRVYGILAAVVFFIVLSTTEAQAVIDAFYGSLLLLGALLMIVRSQSRSIWRRVGFSMIVLLGIFFVTSVWFLFQPDSWLRQTFIEQASGARFAIWDIAWQGIKERPFLGWGPENFNQVFLRYYNPCFGSSACGGEMWYDRAHNKILDVAVESGFLGLVTYLAIFATAIFFLWRAVRSRAVDGKVASILTALFASYFVQNLVNIDVPLTLLFWILLLSYVNVVAFPRPWSFWSMPLFKSMAASRVVVVIGTGLICVVFFFFVLQPFQANLAVRDWFLATDPQARLEFFHRATDLSKVGLDARRWFLARQSAGRVWMADIQGDNVDSFVYEEELLMAENALRETLQRQPNQLMSAIQLALVYHTQVVFFGPDTSLKAEQLLQETIVRNPHNQQPLWALSALYLEEGRVQEALTLTQQALDLDPEVLESYKQRLIVAKFLNDDAVFKEYVQETLAISSNLAPYVDLVARADLNEKRRQLIFELY